MHHSIPGAPGSLKVAKTQAKRLRAALNSSAFLSEEIVHGQALELIAKTHSYESWGHLVSSLDGAPQDEMDFMAAFDGRTETISENGFIDLVFRANNVPCDGMSAGILSGEISATIKKIRYTNSMIEDPDRQAQGLSLKNDNFLYLSELGDLMDTLTSRNTPISNVPRHVEAGLKLLHELAFRQPDAGKDYGNKLPDSVGKGKFTVLNNLPDENLESILLDFRHTAITAETRETAVRVAQSLVPCLDLTVPGPDVDTFLNWGKSDQIRKMILPGDALKSVAGLSASYDILNEDKDPAIFVKRPPISVIVRSSDVERGVEVLLAQARSIGLHIFIWIDQKADIEAWRNGLIHQVNRKVYGHLEDGKPDCFILGRPQGDDAYIRGKIAT